MGTWVHISGIIRLNYFTPNEEKTIIKEEVKKCIPTDFIKNNPYSVKIKINVIKPKIVPKINITVTGDFPGPGVSMDDALKWINGLFNSLDSDNETKCFEVRSCVFLLDDEYKKIIITNSYDEQLGNTLRYIDV